MSDRIDAYLDELADRMPVAGRQARRALEEAGAHLRDAADRFGASGLDGDAAQRAAIAEFGTPDEVARAVRREARSEWATAIALGALAARLVAVGLIAVGVSAVAVAVLVAVLGPSAMFGMPSFAHPSAAACAHWLAVNPGTTTCAQAGTLEASGDLPRLLGVLGILGALVGGAILLLRRVRWTRTDLLPPALGPAIAATAFLGAAVALFVFGVGDVVIANTWGRGMWLTQAAVSLIAAGIACALLVRALARPTRMRAI